MKKLFGLVCVGILLFTGGCVFHHDDHDLVCYEEPPFYTYADFCDDVVGGKCCSWYIYDVNNSPCFEEWCVWDPMCGWEYEGEYCPMVL